MSSPPTVFRFVVAIWVDAIQRQTLNPRKRHIIPKSGESFPRRTDSHATPPIVFVTRMLGICAAVNHTSPRSIDWMLRLLANALAVFRLGLSRALSVITTARVGMSGSQFRSLHNRVITAVATAFPKDASATTTLVLPISKLSHKQTVKSLSREISHNPQITCNWVAGASEFASLLPDAGISLTICA